MPRNPEAPRGRPRLSREKVGYAREIAELGRLRAACLADTRLSTLEYAKLSNAIVSIEKTLRKLDT